MDRMQESGRIICRILENSVLYSYKHCFFMPYKISGKKVVKNDTGKIVGKSKNPKKYLRVLQAVENGWVPGKKSKRKKA